MDEGEGSLYNASVSLEGRQLLEVNRNGGVILGEPAPIVTNSENSKHTDSWPGFHDGKGGVGGKIINCCIAIC